VLWIFLHIYILMHEHLYRILLQGSYKTPSWNINYCQSLCCLYNLRRLLQFILQIHSCRKRYWYQGILSNDCTWIFFNAFILLWTALGKLNTNQSSIRYSIKMICKQETPKGSRNYFQAKRQMSFIADKTNERDISYRLPFNISWRCPNNSSQLFL
jgi:hypothetical protein